ncbi:SRR1-like protein [Diachasma alloeum]|uniref:SRR1-like protein n=1 Tax=Diachasma alloeum TaxID=454923 RepID=UPI0007381F70|nr:SRR1-like protein [Diachasma alloeum]
MPGLDEFQLVTRRRRHTRRQFVNHVLNRALNPREPEINTEHLLREVLDAVIALRNSPYRQILYNGLAESLSLLDVTAIPEIVCYGLGNFSESRSAKYQLAALLTIKSRYRSHVHLYDPVFFSKEIEVLKTLGLSMIEINEEGKRKVGNDLTLFYMPHCFQGIIANCIHANWGRGLSNCILVTNSFGEIRDGIAADAGLRDSVELIKRIHPYVTEFKLEGDFDSAREAFNSTSIHVFTTEKLNRVTQEFWEDIGSPPFNQENFERDLNRLRENFVLGEIQ